jgi:microcystin-dependent protein
MMKKNIVAMMAAFALTHVWAAGGAFTYQGVLLNSDGTAMTGTKTVEFRLYSTPEDGEALWARAYNVLLDSTGLFSTEISDTSGSKISNSSDKTLNQVFAQSATNNLYIGMTVVGSSGEIVPRQRLLAVPYATFACDVSSASGDFMVKGNLTANEAEVNKVYAESIEVKGGMLVSGNLEVSGAISGFGTVPVGGIIMWSGSENEIPDGWALCNGQTVEGQTTPDLRARFVVGAGGAYAVGDTGGAETVTLTVKQIPAHSHSISAKTVGYSGSFNSLPEAVTFESSSINNGWMPVGHSHVAGLDQAHENRPPYYALSFIMRVK